VLPLTPYGQDFTAAIRSSTAGQNTPLMGLF
jgi:hypothetical protein